MNKSSVENLAEVFKCYICLGKLKDAHLCPHCSKPCCYACIRQWLSARRQRSQCPHCLVILHVRNLVKCRWVEEVTHQLDTLQQIEENDTEELCVTHNEKLSVFCLNCQQCICHQCALWDVAHSDHIFEPLEEACLQHAREVDEELIRIRTRHSEIVGVIKGIEKSITDLTNVKNERVDEIKKSARQMISRVEEQLKEKLSTLVSKKNSWSKECRDIEFILESSERDLITCSKTELLLTSKRIMKSISELKHQPICMTQNLHGTTDQEFPSEIIPPYDSGTFIIRNFSVHQIKAEPIYSPPLRASGLTWRLKVYPAGNSNEYLEYLSVHLELNSGFTETSRYQYQVEMVHQRSGDPSKAVVKEFTSEFDVGECWGFNRFYLLNQLVSDGYLSNNDRLILKFRVRFTSYNQKSRVQEWYINQLQAQNMLN